jgi:hypothetical protein
MASTGHQGDPRSRGRRSDGRRHSPAIYRRRRLAVLILALLVVAALAVAGTALAGVLGRGAEATAGATPSGTAESPDSDGAASTPATTASSGPTASATSGPTASASSDPRTSSEPPLSTSVQCDPADITVEAATDRKTYTEDEQPVLSLVVRNQGEEACVLNVGTSQMEFLVTNADGRIFSSADCQQASQDLDRVIDPDGEERAPFEWSRTRSVAACTTVEDEVTAGTYMLTTRLGVINSAPVEFTLE